MEKFQVTVMTFRKTLDKIAAKIRDRVIKQHPNPKGECIAASYAIAKHCELFIPAHSYQVCWGDVQINNDPDNSHSHAWVEIGGLLVDVTADQFNDEGASFPEIVIADPEELREYFASTRIPSADRFIGSIGSSGDKTAAFLYLYGYKRRQRLTRVHGKDDTIPFRKASVTL